MQLKQTKKKKLKFAKVGGIMVTKFSGKQRRILTCPKCKRTSSLPVRHFPFNLLEPAKYTHCSFCGTKLEENTSFIVG